MRTPSNTEDAVLLASLDRAVEAWRASRDGDDSGTPVGQILAAAGARQLVLLQDVSADDVLIEWQLGPSFKSVLRVSRIVRLRIEIEGCRYALVK